MNGIALSIALFSLLIALYSWFRVNKEANNRRLGTQVLRELQRIDSWQPYCSAILGCVRPLIWTHDAGRQTWKLTYDVRVPKRSSQSSLKEHLLILTDQLENAAPASEPLGFQGPRKVFELQSDRAAAVLAILSVARRRMMGALILIGRREHLPAAASLLGDSVELLRSARHVMGEAHTFDGLLDVMKIGLQRAVADMRIEDNVKPLPLIETPIRELQLLLPED